MINFFIFIFSPQLKTKKYKRRFSHVQGIWVERVRRRPEHRLNLDTIEESHWMFLPSQVLIVAFYYLHKQLDSLLISTARGKTHSAIARAWDNPRRASSKLISINNCKTWIRASSATCSKPMLKVFSEMFSHHDMLMPCKRLAKEFFFIHFFLAHVAFSFCLTSYHLHRAFSSDRAPILIKKFTLTKMLKNFCIPRCRGANFQRNA